MTPRDMDRFWAKVDTSGGPDACWPWTAYRDKDSYGQIRMGGRPRRAHGVALEMKEGRPLLVGEQGLHTCDNPPCCNGRHIFRGTNADNVADMVSKGRQAKGARNGHVTHPEATPRGERHGRAKLSETDVRTIRTRYAEGGVTQKALAREYGVAKAAIYYILKGITWTDSARAA